MKLIFCLFLFLISCDSNSTTEKKLPLSFEAKVIGIKDGDTFEVLYNDKPLVIRLDHIDCPEKKQPFGKSAKQFASDICFGKIAIVNNSRKYDRYKRLIAEIYVNDICVNKELVKNGLAWHFKKYSTNSDYSELEQTAKQSKAGLWADENPTPPWAFRTKRK